MEPVSGQILKNIIKALDCSKDPIIITREDRILEAKCADGLEVCYEKDLNLSNKFLAFFPINFKNKMLNAG